jgi:hypothetical protein
MPTDEAPFAEFYAVLAFRDNLKLITEATRAKAPRM